ncbi:MAG: hypothetical protein KKF16_09515 [Euryarchaeota archaeon]|nr:hypothetical protein [Euryarchaeota archaeon]MBV1730150.1 hypothetical protein [Methanobacterium sp.]MBU4547556.1 hypothetical protein [Euryarchaeota archaeon]MBU4607446.1 hypothetical protein [Euryarchaeota archaeon]MBV1754081.1 hypothetical protein [Methanobacterium sp.]
MKIAVAAEAAPARTLAPILEKLEVECLGLSHGPGAAEILKPFCSQIYPIGSGRGNSLQKRSRTHIAYLVAGDTLKAVKALKGKNIDLILTCGNAGDVRKGISAANILRIPVLHLEQDIYNPIEMIAFANQVTAPSNKYKKYLEDNYLLKNIENIGGYPLASYINQMTLKNSEDVKNTYHMDDFILLALGGDLKGSDIPGLIKTMESLEKPVLIVPFRFNSLQVRKMVKSPLIKVVDGFVDLPSIMKSCQAMVYGAGMGITLEAGVLEVSSIKIKGFHHEHSSVDLARDMGIPVVDIDDIPHTLSTVDKPQSKNLIKDAEVAVDKFVNLVNNFRVEGTSKSGWSTFNKIGKARSKFR